MGLRFLFFAGWKDRRKEGECNEENVGRRRLMGKGLEMGREVSFDEVDEEEKSEAEVDELTDWVK